MRNTPLKSLIYVLVGALLTLTSACITDTEATHTEVSLMLDVTEPAQNYLNENMVEMHRFIGNSFDYSRVGTGHFSLQFINHLGKSKVFHLGHAAPGYDYHHSYFTDDYLTFQASLLDTLEFVAKQSFSGSNESRIFESICRELRRLNELPPSSRKVLIVISDFLEHHKGADFYTQAIDEQTYQTLCEASRDSLPQDLNGIEVWLIDTRNEGNVDLVKNAQAFFKEELTARHAIVHDAIDYQMLSIYRN